MSLCRILNELRVMCGENRPQVRGVRRVAPQRNGNDSDGVGADLGREIPGVHGEATGLVVDQQRTSAKGQDGQDRGQRGQRGQGDAAARSAAQHGEGGIQGTAAGVDGHRVRGPEASGEGRLVLGNDECSS